MTKKQSQKMYGFALDTQDIRRALPHRYPMLLIDRVIDLVPESHLVAIKNISMCEDPLLGHFPHQPIQPGVLTTEAMAQAGCIFFAYSRQLVDCDVTYLLARLQSRFLIPAGPGDQMVIKITPEKLMKRNGILNGQVFVCDKMIAETKLSFAVVASKK